MASLGGIVCSLLMVFVEPATAVEPHPWARPEQWPWETWQRSGTPLRSLPRISGGDVSVDNQSIYIYLAQAPEQGRLTFERLFTAVTRLWIWDSTSTPAPIGDNHGGSDPPDDHHRPFVPRFNEQLRLTQTPTDWTIQLPPEQSYPAIVVIDVADPEWVGKTRTPQRPGSDGTITLPASSGEVTGAKLQFEPLLHKNTIGYWVNADDYVTWDFEISRVTAFEVHVLQGCGAGHGGSRVKFEVAQQRLSYEVVDTGHFQNFRWRYVGRLQPLDSGSHRLTVRCEQLANAAVMDIRQIRLVPVIDDTPDAEAMRLLSATTPDVIVPPLVSQAKQPGTRWLERLPSSLRDNTMLQSTTAYHVVGLPTDWSPNRRFPLLVEFVGNGLFRNQLGDTNSGHVEDAELAWGLTGGDGWITLTVPFVSGDGSRAVTQWWGDPPHYSVDPTLTYLQLAIDHVCDQYGADASRVVLSGFSRGSLACSRIGLADSQIAGRWKGLLCCSHIEGVGVWPFTSADIESAELRWSRFADRPVFITHEGSTGADTPLHAAADFFRSLPSPPATMLHSTGYRNHDDAWTLRPGTTRRLARRWLHRVVGLAVEQRDRNPKAKNRSEP